jgi:CO/xanthine dehydrogenase FAD-binding subunit
MVNIPKTLEEALHVLDKKEFIIIAGGTDLMVQKRGWSSSAPNFEKETLFIKQLEELNYIKKEHGMIKVGALTTLEDLLNHEDTPSIYKEALHEMASINIRNEATIAGNIENASPAGDSLPVLYALDAVIVLQSVKGKREIPIIEYITGVRRTLRKPNELIVEIQMKDIPNTVSKWVKVGGRRADAISKVSFVGMADIEDDIVKDLRITFGAVSPTVIRKEEIEKQFIGMKLEDVKSRMDRMVTLYEEYIVPITDQRSNKEYRTVVAKNILKDFINSL